MGRLVEILRVSVTALVSHKLRSALTLLGIVIGVATIIVVVGSVSGLNAYVAEKVFTLSPDVFIVSKFGIITNRDAFLAAVRRKNLTETEMERIRSLCTTCRGVGGSMQGTKSLRSGSHRSVDVNITGSTANLAELYNLDLAAGRFYTEAEVRRSSPVVVIGSQVRDDLFPGIDPLGRVLNIEGYPLKVIGLLREQGSILGQSQDNVAWMPLRLYEKIFGRHRSVDIWVRASSIKDFGETEDEVRMLLRRMRGTPFTAEDPFGMVNAAALQSLWKGISAAALAMMVLIAGISLVVGGIVVMNIMLVSVVERTQEIGVRAALGARRKDILLQFIMEASILAMAGGLVGVLIGAGGTSLVTGLTGFPTLVRPSLVGVALAMAASTGLVFGIWPAWRASRLDPIDALRSE